MILNETVSFFKLVYSKHDGYHCNIRPPTINRVAIGRRESDFTLKSVSEVSLTKSENANRSRQPPRENIKAR